MVTRLKSLLFCWFSLALSLGVSSHAAVLFPGAGGEYGGILSAASAGDPNNSGILTVALRTSGAASLKLSWQGQSYAVKGAFAADGVLTRQIPKKGATGIQLTLTCTLDAIERTMMGTLTDPTADAGAPLETDFFLSGQPPLDIEPRMHMAFFEAVGTSFAEEGVMVVTIARSARRSARFVGQLPDATKFSAGSPLRGNQYAFRAALYPQKKAPPGGQLLGKADVFPDSELLLVSVRWHKKDSTQIVTQAFPLGIDFQGMVQPVVYTPDRDVSYVLTGQRNEMRDASLELSEGNLGTGSDGGAPGPNPLTVALKVTRTGAKVVGANPHQVKLAINARGARFSGSFRHPDTGEKIKFGGALRSFFGVVPGEGRGNFLSLGVPPPRGTPRDPAEARSGSVRLIVETAPR